MWVIAIYNLPHAIFITVRNLIRLHGGSFLVSVIILVQEVMK